ncbi:hypothetical protein Srot_0642 [Segniliparus rotundus DSM 44985]|uniref:Uncharacterized protein n=1 Tax=Segniliparus rotundus (strain ATCC BAA-972 / CDC 1076 / CIP 108378 / DSM 44985 / JCM 13578) TaxID=640132 RepID=D6ZCT2_SEGRD|nr:hypothetical protein [Segniliparus rotundus]ADG97124.1 hypothetical protein Srot_0642 [Segniliparus rotundus DSM 44985]
MSRKNTEAGGLDGPKHGPESFLAVIATTLALMAEAMFGKDGWYPYTLLGLGMLGFGLAVQTGTARRAGMGVLAAVLGAVVFRYLFWLFAYTIPGMFFAIFSSDPSDMRF